MSFNCQRLSLEGISIRSPCFVESRPGVDGYGLDWYMPITSIFRGKRENGQLAIGDVPIEAKKYLNDNGMSTPDE